MKKKITKNTTLDEILKIKGVEKILAKHKVPCLGCPFAAAEARDLRLEDICQTYEIALNELLGDLNKN